jgi:hypothetical protein
MVMTTLRSLLVNAGKGNVPQQRMVIELLSAIEGQKRNSRLALVEALVEFKRAEHRRLPTPGDARHPATRPRRPAP